MAEGNKFSERKSRLQDFKASIGGGGGQTQQTQQDDGSQQTGKVFDTPRSLDIPRSNRSGGIELPGITTQYSSTLPKTGFIGAIEQGKVQGNVVLPGINDRAKSKISTADYGLSEGLKKFDDLEKRERAEQIQLDFIDAKERAEKNKNDVNDELLVSWEQGARNWWKNVRGGFSQWQSNTLEGMANRRIEAMKRAGFDTTKDEEYVKALQQENLDYKNKIGSAFKTWQKNNVNQKLAKEYDSKTFTELARTGDGQGFKYKLNKLFADNISLLPNIVITTINTPVGLTLMGTDAYIQESENEFDDLMKNGATYDQAKNGAFWYGALSASVELWLEKTIGLVGPASRGIRGMFKKTIKEGIKRTYKTLPEIIFRAGRAQLKSGFGEGLEEFVQEILGNRFVSNVNPNRSIFDNIRESAESGLIMGLIVPGGALESVTKDIQSNKEIEKQADIEAIKYVMDREERKAQRIDPQKLKEAKERMKDRFLNPTMDNGYTPSEEQAEQRANERDENEEFEDEMKRENQEGPNYTEEDEQRFTREGIEEQQQADELRSRQNEEVTLENEMAKEALSENINEDLGDPRYQKIDEDLQDIKDSLEKMDDNTFFNRIMSSINKGNKNYVVTTDKNGNKSVLRVVERGGNTKGSNGKTVTVQVMQPSKKSGNVSVSEFTYTPGNLTTDQKQGIITGFENWGKTGNFSDNTAGNERYQLKYEEKGYKPGVAGKNEKSISGKEGVQQRNKINDETIEQLANKYGVRVDVIKGLIKVLKDGKWNGKDYAYGKYLDQVLTLSEQIKESTAPHELLHAIFDMIDPETKAYLISQVMKSEGWSASKAEEWLADSFSNFFRTGKIEGAPKSTWGKIKIFFKRVRSFINGLGRWRSELEEIFTDIITAEDIEDLQGRIDRSEKLNEAKARMKKRFMEYAKNAEKLQKKAESEGKYQKIEQDGISALQKIADGADYVRDAMDREDLKQYGGETGISFYWGEPGKKDNNYKGGYGISHIAEKHGADTLLKMIEVLARGKITRYVKSIDRVSIGYDGYTAILSLSKDNGKETRLVTGRKDNEKKTDGSSEVSTQSTPTQISPTFSRTDLGAVLLRNSINKNNKKASKNDIRYQTVYHGSRAEFDKFDSSHMGEGEGDQVHGRGHYVAVDPKTAKRYAELGAVLYKGKQIGGYDNILSEIGDLPTDKKNFLKDIAYDVAKKGKTVQEAKDDLINKYKGFIKDLEESVKDNEKNLEKLEKSGKTSRIDYNQLIKNGKDYIKRDKELLKIIENIDVNDFSKRHFYEVEIPDPVKADTPTGSNYFEEKKILNKEEINRIMDALLKKKTKGSERVQKAIDYDLKDGEDISGRSMVFNLRAGLGDKQASKFLESLGYDGIHYYGLRDGEAYVIFNDDDLEIMNHEKYQTADDIDPNATSPDQLVEVNDQGLDVMVRFVSEKQKKNALNVNKELLTSDGNPYMWTSTNKYKSKVITDWRNVEDSKYKEFSDKGIQIAWFTNNSEMSYSYADYESKLAPVKKFTSIAELNKFFKENPNNYERALGNGIDDGVLRSSTVYEMKKVDGGYELISNNIESVTKDMEKFYDDINNDRLGGNIGDVPKDKNEALKKLQKYYDDHNYEIEGERTVRLLKDGKVEKTIVKEGNTINKFDTKLDALAQGYTIAQEADRYHYKGIIQKVKNPLVVDVKSEGNNPSRWSSLGGAYEFLKKNEKNLDKQINDFKSNIQKIINERNSFYRTDIAKVDKLKDKYRDEYYEAKKNWDGDNTAMDEAKKKITIIREVRELIDDMLYRGGNEYISAISKEQSEFKIDDNTTLGDIYNKAVELNRKYEELHIHFGNVYNIKDYIQKKLPNIAHYINKSPLFVSDLSSLGGLANLDLERLLTDSKMETNDYVFYALNKGGYDGVLFKNIVDYGSTPKEGWKDPKGGDVVATFKSNQFKNWDNEDPTDSKYIRYQTVYHGSQAEFDKFDSSHMGEGEGAQAHGWGHYVAVDPKTGKEYAETLAGPRYKGKEMYELASDLPGYQWNVINHVAEQMRDGVDIENAIANDKKWHEYLLNKAEENLKTEKDEDNIDYLEREIKQQKEMIKIADGLKVSDFETSRGRRNFYEVEIPDIVDADTPTGTNYFEENKVLTRSEIEKILNKLLKRKTQGAERVKNAIDYDLKDGEKIDGRAMVFNLRAGLGNKKASKFLESLGYDGIHYFGGKDGEAYVIFNDDNLEIKNHEKYQKVEYEYDENGKPKWIKFGDNSEFNPNIFGEPTKQDKIEEDKEKEKNNAFYDAWMRYNDQNYADDQLTMDEFLDGVMKWLDKQQSEYDQKMNDLSQAQNDPKMLELQLRAVKLMEEEGQVGKKFGKNVSKEVRDRQQKEVERKREQLIKDIFDWMYPGLRFEEATYDDQMRADEREAEWEMMGREGIEEKLKYFKKDKNGNWEAKNIKIENPEEKWNKIVKSGNFDEVFTPTDRVLEWRTPQGQKGRLDRAKDPKKYKSVMEKINGGTTKTKVTLKDVTQEVRALEKQKAMEEAEKERKKKERNEAMAKKKQDEYKKMVRMKAFQKLVDMQRFEEYPFLTEDEIKTRYGFTDDEWKTITEQEEIKLPKKWSEKAVSDFNKAVDSQVKALMKGLNWQNNLKRKDAEKNLGEIGDIDIDVLLGRDEEKGQKEVEEFEKISKEENREEGKIDEGKSEWEKEIDKKTRKQKKQAEKLTKERNEMFRKAEEKRNERYANKEEKVIDEVKTEEEAKNIAKESRWKKAKNWIKETTIQDLIQPISSRIEQISPRIYLEMMRFEQNISVKTNIRMKQIEDFVKKMSEIRSKNKKDYINITLHLLNGNVGTANQMLEKYGTSIPRQVLDEIWADAEDVGYTMNYEGFYYPRKVKDVKEFLDRFAKVENKNVQSEIEKIIKKKREQAQKRGEEFTKQQEADLINQLLMDGEVEGITLGSGHMKQRKVDNIIKNMLEFYEDPVDALLQYITGMTEAIEKARFLGQGKRGEIKTLGEFIADEGIQGWDAEELRKLLLARFNYAPMSKGVAGLKNIANIIHLGSPSSALSQLADVSFSLIENGLTNIVQGLTRKYNLDLDALGVTNRGEEMKSQGKNETAMDKIQRFTFRWTGFNMMDQFGKKTLVVSTLNKLIKYAKNNDPQLRKDLSRRFDDPKMIDGIIEDLKAGILSENVNLFLFTKLADVQPLTRMQMPKTYLTSGNGRIFYQFKTFAVKQLDYLIQKGKRDLKTKGTAKGLRSIVVMMGIIMLCGAGADELKDFTMGRKYSSWIWRMINDDDWSVAMLSDRFWDNLLKLTGLTKYSIYQARTQGIKSTVEDLFFSLSSLDVLTYPMQDIQDAFSEDGLDFSQASSWQLIPIVGKYGYWWAGAGQTKQQKKLDKEKKKKKGSSSGGPRSRA